MQLQELLLHPRVLGQLLLFGLTSALGQVFIYITLTQYDSLVVTTVTTLRKFVTILLSVYYYGHSVTISQVIAICLVFGAAAADVVMHQLSFSTLLAPLLSVLSPKSFPDAYSSLIREKPAEKSKEQ